MSFIHNIGVGSSVTLGGLAKNFSSSVGDSKAEPLSTEVLTEAELLACLDMPQSNRVIDRSKVIDA